MRKESSNTNAQKKARLRDQSLLIIQGPLLINYLMCLMDLYHKIILTTAGVTVETKVIHLCRNFCKTIVTKKLNLSFHLHLSQNQTQLLNRILPTHAKMIRETHQRNGRFTMFVTILFRTVLMLNQKVWWNNTRAECRHYQNARLTNNRRPHR